MKIVLFRPNKSVHRKAHTVKKLQERGRLQTELHSHANQLHVAVALEFPSQERSVLWLRGLEHNPLWDFSAPLLYLRLLLVPGSSITPCIVYHHPKPDFGFAIISIHIYAHTRTHHLFFWDVCC